MKEQLRQRLTALKAEFDAGQKMLTELERNRAELKTTLTRISGAIQVLEEELAKAAAVPSTRGSFGDQESNGVARLNAHGS